MIWENFKTVKKGNIGEKLVNEFLISKGYIPYSPDINGAHPFDRLVASRDKRIIFVADSKAKPARTYYPDTGIDIKHYDEYLFIQEKYNIDIFLFFVDEDKAEIYGNWLRELNKERTITHLFDNIKYPLRHKGIIYFPLMAMIHVANIPNEEVQRLRALSGRNSNYSKGVPD